MTPSFGSLIKIYDIEVMKNLFLYLDIDIKNDEINTFIIHPSQNDLISFLDYISKLKGQIGFNNLRFDSQIIQFMILRKEYWEFISVDEILNEIFEFAQETINRQDTEFPKYNEKELYCAQCDLLKVHHFDNKGKRQSLKGLQCNLNWYNVQEMPFDFRDFISEKDLKAIIDYCKNDILSTKELYRVSAPELDVRKGLAKSYNLPITSINWSNSKIGSELVLKFYCEYTKKNPYEIRKSRSKRSEIYLKECIPDNVGFKTKQFNWLLNKFQNTVLKLENGFRFINEYSKNKNNREEICVNYKGLNIYYGIGGVHASLEGVFESSDEYMIYDIDVSSLYPSIAISNNYYPEHLGPEFLKVYNDNIVSVRLEEKKKLKLGTGNPAIVEGLKQAANSVYGKSNELFSFLYDPKYTFSTTITGQLQLSMLVEDICENIKNITLIQLNTDGATFLLKRKDLEIFKQICKNWEKLVKLELEGVEYKKMYIRDVNNYCAVKTNGEVKLKGCFEKNKLLYKDPSARIITIALEEYIVNNTPIEKTINKHDKIWDFLKRQKFKKNSEGNYLTIENGTIKPVKAQKVARYFISSSGHPFVKRFIDCEDDKNEDISNNYYRWKRKNAIEKGWLCKDANIIKSDNAFEYDINRRYYIEETRKIIDSVEKNKKQMNLF